MGERKVQAKYYPPDFDPSKLPRIQKKRQNDDAVRFMLPMSIRCETCGEFMGTGLKFNARKSDTNENYLGIRIFRFSMKCKACPTTFTIRTDPKNSDYTCESGARRNYEPWREAKAAEEEAKEERKRQDEDVIQKLENKTKDAKQEMEDLDALDELKGLNAKRATVSVDDVLKQGKERDKRREQTEEEEMRLQAKLAFEQKRSEKIHCGLLPASFPTRNDEHRQYSTPEKKVIIRGLPVGLKIVRKIEKPSSKPTRAIKLSKPTPSAPRNASDSNLSSSKDRPLIDFTGYGSSSGSDEE